MTSSITNSRCVHAVLPGHMLQQQPRQYRVAACSLKLEYARASTAVPRLSCPPVQEQQLYLHHAVPGALIQLEAELVQHLVRKRLP